VYVLDGVGEGKKGEGRLPLRKCNFALLCFPVIVLGLVLSEWFLDVEMRLSRGREYGSCGRRVWLARL